MISEERATNLGSCRIAKAAPSAAKIATQRRMIQNPRLSAPSAPRKSSAGSMPARSSAARPDETVARRSWPEWEGVKSEWSFMFSYPRGSAEGGGPVRAGAACLVSGPGQGTAAQELRQRLDLGREDRPQPRDVVRGRGRHLVAEWDAVCLEHLCDAGGPFDPVKALLEDEAASRVADWPQTRRQ